jgi:hypothetical protein
MARVFVAGSSQYLVNSNAVVGAFPMTMACWAYSNNITTNYMLMSLGDKDTDLDYMYIAMRGAIAGDPVRFALFNQQVGADYTEYETSNGFSATTWHHVAGVAPDFENAIAYLDGDPAGAYNFQTARPWPEIDSTALGVLIRSSITGYLDGRMAEAAIWSAALTAAELAILAEGYSPLMVRPQSLVAYWPLMGNLSPEIDIVGGYDMTLTNAPTKANHPRVFYPYTPFHPAFTAAGAPAATVFMTPNRGFWGPL